MIGEFVVGRTSFETDCSTFLSALPRDQTVGNLSLRAELGWRDERYWRVHAVLGAKGKIAKGRGRGGSVTRIGTSRAALG